MTPTRTPARTETLTHRRRPPRVRSRRLLAGALVVVTAGSLAALTLPSGSTAPSAKPSAVAADVVVQPALVVAPRKVAPLRAARTRPLVRYVRRTVPVGATFSGNASWYGGSFQGRRTANGERFDTAELTAASKTLPFNTRVRVCRRSRCVVVRINDRGPYVGGRVLDLSRAASRALGYSGVAYITATPVGTRSVAVPAAAPKAPVRRAPVRKPVVQAAVRKAASPLPIASPAASPAPVAARVLAADPSPISRPGAALIATALLASCGLVHARRRRVRS